MQRIFIYLLFIFLPAGYSATTQMVEPVSNPMSECKTLYNDMQLENIVSYNVFEQAIEGYNKIDVAKKDIITLIDFSKPSTEERLYVLDIKQKKLLFSSLVSHGRNSGENYATSFSNENGSHKSSLGFYVTENTYKGKNGYSLILNGLEKGINDLAKQRAVVIHAAAYCNPSVIASSGRLGRSHGCPALPQALNTPIINAIKGGTLLFIYANDKKYFSQSSILSSHHIASHISKI